MNLPSWLEAVNWSDVGKGCGEHLLLRRMNEDGTLLARQAVPFKADSHIAGRAHTAPMPFVNSQIPCRAPALLRQSHVLRESLHGSRKYPNY